ncbi:hypothetical protein MKZ38_006424 [Zalerion maritima]|uniref:Uncharacterized protein n=1 Tax=Zalerion maritima TaxID=339359 RepID=A0AAD5RIU5_9PEZI|nr:hypothetical protein MKZ38_006424 [Zalerion maritima]
MGTNCHKLPRLQLRSGKFIGQSATSALLALPPQRFPRLFDEEQDPRTRSSKVRKAVATNRSSIQTIMDAVLGLEPLGCQLKPRTGSRFGVSISPNPLIIALERIAHWNARYLSHISHDAKPMFVDCVAPTLYNNAAEANMESTLTNLERE